MDISIAIKEWSVVIEALGSGDQLMLIRKLQPPKEPFLLYPTYTFYTIRPRKLSEAIKDSYYDLAVESASRALESAQNEGLIRIAYMAECGESIRVRSASVLRRLESHYLWQPEHVVDYMRGGTLYVWLARVYRLLDPVTLDKEATAGSVVSCRIEPKIRISKFEPILDDETFAQRKNELVALAAER